MRRLAFISDQHFDQASRWEEMLRIADWIAEDLRGRKVDAILLGGDLFERRPTPLETRAATEWVLRLAQVAPVVAVYGNHDVPESLDVLPWLESRHPIRVHARPAVESIAGCAIACMPWPRKAQLKAALGDVGQHEAGIVAGEMMRAILIGLGDQMDAAGGERVFVGHCMMRGSRVSTGQPLMPGADFELGTEDLALARASVYLLGHIHLGAGNEWTINGSPCFYVGSPRRTAYGEVEEKRYAIVEVDGGRVSTEFIPTPCTPMILLEGAWTEIGDSSEAGSYYALDWPHDPRSIEPGADVRLRYDVDANRRDEARAAADLERRELLARGAIAVKVEEVVRPTSKARAPEVATARTLAEKLGALWTARGAVPGDEERSRLLLKLATLEEQHAA